jgi:hypothetical protein
VGFNGGTKDGAEESSSKGSRIANGAIFDDLFVVGVGCVCFGLGL